jgi:hypothetical protein
MLGWPAPPLLAGGAMSAAGVGEPVGVASGFDDLPGECQPVDNGSAQPWVGESLCPRREWLVGGDCDGRALFSLGENLKQQFGAAPVQLQVAQLVDLCRCRDRSTYADPAIMPSLPRRELKTPVAVELWRRWWLRWSA